MAHPSTPVADFAPLLETPSAFRRVALNAHLSPTPAPPDAPVAATNEVSTSRYTWWNFAPLFLFESFSKTANVYFLLVSVFQMIPSISPTAGVPTQLFPLAAVILIDAVFAAVEDYRRHQDDARANAAPTRVFDAPRREFRDAAWRDLRVGDVVKILNHETVPADVVILAVVSDVDGVCYVETKSLDGESNLKAREAPKPTRRMFDDERAAGDRVSGFVETELPNTDVHSFSGAIYANAVDAEKKAHGTPLSIKNVLLRGSKLRNADAVYGLVVNTGEDCKVIRSATSNLFPAKVSSLDAVTNRQVQIVVALLVIVCVVGAVTDNSSLAELFFVTAFVDKDSADKSLIETLAYYLTILCDLVPITLYVTITVVRAFQSFFMSQDLLMYHEESDTRLAVRSMQLNEQLGQISHVFADKTGTLTCNDMELRKCSIHGEEMDDVHTIGMTDDPHHRAFFTHMALCHSVLIEHGTGREYGSAPEYSAASPDEQALVSGASVHGGVAFAKREPEYLTLQFADGVEEVYHVLEVFDFTSTRKRMTVVVQKQTQADDEEQNQGEDNVLVLTKGSDSVLFGRLALDRNDNARLRDTTQRHLTAFAHDGLRTLVFTSKTVSQADWDAFHGRYRRARADLKQVEAQSQGLENDIDALQDEMERGLDLLGATAIEDRLQDGVPETIAKLREAGVAVWMLTGDMQETAMNIGLSCHLLDDHMQCHVIRTSTSVGSAEDEERNSTLSHHGHVANVTDEHASVLRQLDDAYQSIVDKSHGTDDHALVIDGASLNFVLGTGESDDDQRLLRVAERCRAVIACRVSPLQKAQLVELVKHNVKHAHTLAIGDGANDVPMLRTAHVGVGIAGQEGMQAVNSSDYAFAQFRFLLPLLFVHGRWNYNRVAGLIGYTFYKNIVYSLSLFWFCMRTTSYSGAMFYSPMIQQFYNLVFTVLPIALFAIQDRDLPTRELALEFPKLYHREARRSVEFTQRTFWTWVALAVVDSAALFFVILGASFGVMRHGGTVELTVLWSLGWTIMVSLVTARYCLLVNSWTIFEVAGVVFSLGSMLGVQILFDSITWGGEDFNTYSFPWLLGRPQLWLGVVFAVVAILLKDVAYAAYGRRFRPQLIDRVHEKLQLQRQHAQTGLDARDLEVGLADLEESD